MIEFDTIENNLKNNFEHNTIINTNRTIAIMLNYVDNYWHELYLRGMMVMA